MFRSFRLKQRYLTGFSPGSLYNNLRFLPRYFRDIRTYERMNPRPNFRITFEDAFPILSDMQASAGTVSGYYFHQDLWAARKIFSRRPAQHFDVGSRTDGFVAHLLVFMPVTVIDIRHMESNLPGLTFFQDDATDLANFPDNSVDSISTLHAVEHFGLGRYTDPIDPEACFRFMGALARVLAPGGRLYFSTPVGRERLEFNAHRVFAPQTILTAFSDLALVSFSFVDDGGDLQENADPLVLPPSEMACGLFEFTKTVA